MILKVLLVALVIAVVYFMVKKKPAIKEKEQKEQKESSDMVECSECKVYCEIGDAIVSGGKYYCSKECIEGRK